MASHWCSFVWRPGNGSFLGFANAVVATEARIKSANVKLRPIFPNFFMSGLPHVVQAESCLVAWKLGIATEDVKRLLVETELRRVDKQLSSVEADFTKNLDLLKRDVLN